MPLRATQGGDPPRFPKLAPAFSGVHNDPLLDTGGARESPLFGSGLEPLSLQPEPGGHDPGPLRLEVGTEGGFVEGCEEWLIGRPQREGLDLRTSGRRPGWAGALNHRLLLTGSSDVTSHTALLRRGHQPGSQHRAGQAKLQHWLWGGSLPRSDALHARSSVPSALHVWQATTALGGQRLPKPKTQLSQP